MEQKVCLDTDVVIALLNNEERANNILTLIEDAEVYISTITLFELLLRETNLEAIELLRNKTHILSFDEKACREASIIFKQLKQKGRMNEIRDIFIATICISNQCTVATFNKKHFSFIDKLHIL